MAIAGLAVAASEVWPEAKSATGGLFVAGITAFSNPLSWVVVGVVAGLSLAGYIWSGAKMEERTDFRSPTVPLHIACRWIARDSDWAAQYPWSDDEWCSRVRRELLEKWQTGRIEMFGIERGGGDSMRFVPAALRDSGKVDFDAGWLATERPPKHIWDFATTGKDGHPTVFDMILLDYDQMRQVWPARGLSDRLRKNSPVERIGDYGPTFDAQDANYRESALERLPSPTSIRYS